MFLDGSVAPDRNPWGEPILDRNLLVLVNGADREVGFLVPETARPGAAQDVWRLEVDTAVLGPDETPRAVVQPGDRVLVAPRSLRVHWSVWDPVL